MISNKGQKTQITLNNYHSNQHDNSSFQQTNKKLSIIDLNTVESQKNKNPSMINHDFIKYVIFSQEVLERLENLLTEKIKRQLSD